MGPFKTTSLNVSAAASVGTTLSAQGIIYAQGGNSSQWNSAYTTVLANSASWEESAEILPTVTNYLSTNNILVQSINIGGTDVGISKAIGSGNFQIKVNNSSVASFGNNGSFSFGINGGGVLKPQNDGIGYIYDLPKKGGTIALTDDILPTVTNYLSTNNVLMSEATITNDLIVGGTVYSSGSADVLAKYTETIGNGTSFSINHNFLTSDVQVQVYKVSDGVLSYPTVEITSISAVTVKFAQSIPAASYKVIVHGTVPSNQINAYGGTPATEFQSLTFTTSSYELSITNGNTVSLASLSSTGSGITTDKKFDYVTVFGVDYSYSGTAIQGTLDTSSTWKLIRLTYNNNGTISNSASAINSWTGRLTATYV